MKKTSVTWIAGIRTDATRIDPTSIRLTDTNLTAEGVKIATADAMTTEGNEDITAMIAAIPGPIVTEGIAVVPDPIADTKTTAATTRGRIADIATMTVDTGTMIVVITIARRTSVRKGKKKSVVFEKRRKRQKLKPQLLQRRRQRQKRSGGGKKPRRKPEN